MENRVLAYETCYQGRDYFQNMEENLKALATLFPAASTWVVHREGSTPPPLEQSLQVISWDAEGRYLKRICGDGKNLVRVKMLDVPLKRGIMEKFLAATPTAEGIAYCDFDDIGFFGSFMESVPGSLVRGMNGAFRMADYKDRLYYLDGPKKHSYWLDFEDRLGYFEDTLPKRYRLPGAVNVEVSSKCMLRCKMCWTGGDKYRNTRLSRPAPFMSMDLYLRILDQVAEIFHHTPPILCLIFRGEPLLHKDIVPMIEEAGRRNARVLLVTNAMLLSEKLSERLIDAGLWEIVFSVNSHDPETYGRIQIGGDLARVRRNIHDFLKVREKAGRSDLRVSYRAVVQEENESQVDAMVEAFLTPEIFSVCLPAEMVRTRAPLGGCEASRKYFPLPRKVPCWQLWWGCTITTEGRVLPCATCTNEMEGEVMGNVRDNHLLEIWNNDLYRRYREHHLADRIDEVPFCRNCDQHMASNWSNDPRIRNGIEEITYPSLRVFRRVR